MFQAQALLAMSLFLAASTAGAVPTEMHLAQAGKDESFDAEYKQRIDSARTPEEKDRLRTEYELRKKGGSVPDKIEPAHPVPGTGGSESMPKRDGGPQSGSSNESR